MKINQAFIGVLCGVQTTFCFALNLSDAPIQHVTLYPTLAKIERSIPVKSGERIVQLNGLAAHFDVSKLQYQTSNIDVNAVSHNDNSVERPLSKASSEITNEIKKIEDQLTLEKAKKSASELQTSFLEKLNKGSSTKIRKEAIEAYIEMSNATIQIEKLEKRRDELKLDLQNLRDSSYKNRNLKFYVNAPKNGEIKITYFIDLARWQPMYKAELDTINKQVKLTRMAMIAQKTGEDWHNIDLTISTTAPQDNSYQLKPKNWQINYYEPDFSTTKKASAKSSPMRQSQLAEDLNYDPFPQFNLNELEFTTEFRTDTKASIASSLEQIYLPLGTESYPAQISIWAIPDQSSQAIINAEIPKSGQTWPSGILKLYRDGNYIGERKWSENLTDKLQMNFGVDDQVIVKTIIQSDKKDQLNQSKSSTTQKKNYLIENQHKFPIDLNVFESLPQSLNSKLIVNSTFSPQPSAIKWEDQNNVHLWQRQLAPKEKFKLDVKYEFEYPNVGRTSGF